MKNKFQSISYRLKQNKIADMYNEIEYLVRQKRLTRHYYWISKNNNLTSRFQTLDAIKDKINFILWLKDGI